MQRTRQSALATAYDWAAIHPHYDRVVIANKQPSSGTWNVLVYSPDAYYKQLREEKGFKPSHHTVVYYPK